MHVQMHIVQSDLFSYNDSLFNTYPYIVLYTSVHCIVHIRTHYCTHLYNENNYCTYCMYVHMFFYMCTYPQLKTQYNDNVTVHGCILQCCRSLPYACTLTVRVCSFLPNICAYLHTCVHVCSSVHMFVHVGSTIIILYIQCI